MSAKRRDYRTEWLDFGVEEPITSIVTPKRQSRLDALITVANSEVYTG
jgi:hypothetical protein